MRKTPDSQKGISFLAILATLGGHPLPGPADRPGKPAIRVRRISPCQNVCNLLNINCLHPIQCSMQSNSVKLGQTDMESQRMDDLRESMALLSPKRDPLRR